MSLFYPVLVLVFVATSAVSILISAIVPAVVFSA